MISAHTHLSSCVIWRHIAAFFAIFTFKALSIRFEEYDFISEVAPVSFLNNRPKQEALQRVMKSELDTEPGCHFGQEEILPRAGGGADTNTAKIKAKGRTFLSRAAFAMKTVKTTCQLLRRYLRRNWQVVFVGGDKIDGRDFMILPLWMSRKTNVTFS